MIIRRLVPRTGFAFLAALFWAALFMAPCAFAVSGDHIAPDGEYCGTAHCNEGYDVTVSYSVIDGKIANCGIDAPGAGGNEVYLSSAIEGMVLDGVKASPNDVEGIDVVSGATFTCSAIKNAVRASLVNADAGVSVSMSSPVRDEISGRYSFEMTAFATNPGATEASGTSTVLRCAVGDRFALDGAEIDVSIQAYHDGAWADEGKDLEFFRDGDEITVTGFDYVAHCLSAEGAQGPEGAERVVVSAKGVDPRYADSDQRNATFNAAVCGLYSDAEATSRIAGPAQAYAFDIPALVAVPVGKQLAYTGDEQIGVEYQGNACTIRTGSTIRATEPGDYLAIVQLKHGQGLRWADGTWEARFVSWSISHESADDTPGASPGASGDAGAPLVPAGKQIPAPTAPKKALSITVGAKVVTSSVVDKAVAKAGGDPRSVTTVVVGKNVKKIAKGAFSKLKSATTVIVKTKKLKKKSVKGSLKGSAIKTVKVQVGSKKANKKAAKKYKKIFTKKIAGKKVKVK